MSDLRKAAEMALEMFDWLERRSMYQDLQMKDTHEALRQALAQPEQEAFTLDRGCWDRGCCAYDTRDGDGVIVYVDAVNISQECVDKTTKHKHEEKNYAD
jgi:hypothetical protein